MALPAVMTPLERAWHYTLWAICGLVFLFLVVPILVVMPLSFNAEPFFTYPMPGYSLRWYQEIFFAPGWRRAAENSMIIAVATTVLATALGTLAALGLNHAEFPLKQAVVGFLISPLIVPIVIAAIGMFFFFARLDLAYTIPGIVLAHTALAAPFVVILVSATLAGFDKNHTRAGASLGANPVQVFRRVTMPLIMPGIASGAVLAFVTSFDEVVVVLFLAGPEQHTLTREMWKGVREQINPAILALCCLLVVVSLILLVSMEALRRRSQRLRGLKP